MCVAFGGGGMIFFNIPRNSDGVSIVLRMQKKEKAGKGWKGFVDLIYNTHI